MEKKFLVIGTILIIFIITMATATLIKKNKNNNLKLSSTELEECKSLYYNGEDKINILFFSSENQAKTYSDKLFKTNPFKKEQFNVYYITDYNPECEIYKGEALLCYSKSNIKKASSCPSDYIVTIEEHPATIRSSAYMNIISLNANHPTSVFIHEFGHTFANFAEEYVPAKLPKNAPNCFNSCEQFETKEGCYKGCSSSEYHRSTKNGIMRTLSSTTFGLFNENLLQKRINTPKLSLTGKATSDTSITTKCTNQKYQLIEAEYNSNTKEIDIKEKSKEIGCIGTNGYGDSEYELIKNDGTIISKQKFNPDLIFTDVQHPNKEENTLIGETYESDKPFILKVPIKEEETILKIETQKKTTSLIIKSEGNDRPCLIN